MNELDFSKLSLVKKQIVMSAIKHGYVTDNTYQREKEALRKRGWLQGHCPDGVHIISGQWMLTQAARDVMGADREHHCTECSKWFLGCLNGREKWHDKAIMPNLREVTLADGTKSHICDAFELHPDPNRKGRAVY